MPEFDIQLPDGRVATIAAQDEATALRGAQEWHAANPAPMTGGERLADVGRSIVSTGLPNLASGIAGLPGDIQGATQAGAEWLAGRKLPQSPIGQFPTSGDVRGKIEEWTGPLHKPQTPEGKMAAAGVEFLPGALLPGGPGRRLLNVLMPAAGSELGGAVAKGFDLPEGWGKLAGGVMGGLTPSALGRMVTPFPATAGRTAAANVLRNEGVTDITAGQATGRKGLQAFESEMGGGRGAEMMERQGEQFTSAVLRRIGENSPRATADVLNRAYDRMGVNLRVVDPYTLHVDRRFANDFATLQGDYARFANPNQRETIHSAVEDVIGTVQRNNGTIPGAEYRTMRERMGTAMRNARSSGDNQVADAYSNMIGALDEAMERSMQGIPNARNDLNTLREARRQYRDFLTVERAVTNSAGAAGTGLITPQALTQAIKANEGRRSLALGRSNFDELAKAGDQVMAPLPNSGTPVRSRAQNLGMSTAGAGVGGGVGAWLGGPVGGAVGAVAGGYTPAVAGRAAMSPIGQWWLANQGLAGALNNGPSQLQQAILNTVLARPKSDSLIALPQR